MSYLEQLMLRLAVGAQCLPEPLRRRHASYLRSAQRADGGYAGREGPSDLYYTSFALRGLALLGELEGEAAERAAQFLTSRLNARVAIVDFLSLVYGAKLLETAAGLDVFSSAAPGWREAVADELERFRRADGGYAKTDEGNSSSTYYSFLMVLCLELLEKPIVEPARLVDFVRSRARPDGGFVEMGPMQRSGTNPTAAAIGLLKVLDALNDDVCQSTLDFVAEMQSDEGGLRANTRIPLADVLSTFTGLLTLANLDGLGEVDLSAAHRYVVSMQADGGGFRGGEWDGATDVEYTFYGLGGLCLALGAGTARPGMA